MIQETIESFLDTFPFNTRAMLYAQGTTFIEPVYNPWLRLANNTIRRDDSYTLTWLSVFRNTLNMVLLPTDRFYYRAIQHNPLKLEWWIVPEGQLRPMWRLVRVEP